MSDKHIPSLAIRNYRSLECLDIDRLGRVNLIVGRNNIGKSSLLEAILLLGTDRAFLPIRDILRSRNECLVEEPDRFQEFPLLGLHHLFTGFPVLSAQTAPISISTQDQKQNIDLQIGDSGTDTQPFDTSPPIIVRMSGTSSELHAGMPFNFDINLSYRDHSPPVSQGEFAYYLNSRCLYFSPNVNNASRVPTSKLWEQVEISGRETAVIDSLQLIESGIEKVFFVGSAPRIPFCRIKGRERPVPLHGMGDGISRLFELTLGIVNVAGGICLIDEFENGLHWSVQEQIWKVVFKTAQKLDVQIFATTHSLDTVRAFQEVALRQKDENFGGIVQMKKQNGKTIAKSIFGEDIRKVHQYEVEVR